MDQRLTNLIEAYSNTFSSCGTVYRMKSGSNQDFSAYFDHEALDLGFLDLNIDAIANNFEELDAALSDYRAGPNGVELIAKAGGIDSLKFIEIMAHESFHIIQFASMKSVHSLISAVQYLRTIKFNVFLWNLTQNGTWQAGEVIFSAIDRLDDDGKKLFLSQSCELATEELKLIDNFYADENGLSALHLVEGSAYIFQKLAIRTADIETFTEMGNDLYTRAYSLFEDKQGCDELLFIFLCRAALCCGSARNWGYSSQPTPVSVFQFLLENIESYNTKYDHIFSPKLCATFGESILEIRFLKTIENDTNLIKVYSKLEPERKTVFKELVNLYETISNDAKEHFGFETILTPRTSLPEDTPENVMEAKLSWLYEQHPSIDSVAFMIASILDFNFLVEFGTNFFRESENCTYKFNRQLSPTAREDKFAHDILKGLEVLMSGKIPWCCSKHGVPSGSRFVYGCESEDSLDNRVRMIANRGIMDLIKE